MILRRTLTFSSSPRPISVNSSDGLRDTSSPYPVRRRIDGLKGIQVEHSKIESEFQMAILELEKKVSLSVLR